MAPLACTNQKRGHDLTDTSYSSTTVAIGGGVQVSLSRQGRGPVVLLLHGIGGRKEHWCRVMAQLGNDAALIAPDARNYGGSDGPPIKHFSALAQDTIGLLDALGVTKVIGVGHSMGGRTLIEAAIHRPERFSALLLSGAQPAYLEHMSQAEAAAYVAKRRAMFTGGVVVPGMANNVARSVLPPHASLDVIRAVTEGFLCLRQDGYLSALAASVGWDRRPDLNTLQMPIAVTGGELDTVCPPQATHTLANLIGQGSATILPGIGHMAPLEAPQQLAEQVRNLLGQHGPDADHCHASTIASL